MELTIDHKKYDKLQFFLLEQMIRTIKDDIEFNGITGEKVKELTQDIAYTVAAFIDATSVIELDGERVMPYLAFSVSENARNHIIVNEGGSYMHEVCHGFVSDIFEEPST